MEKVWIFGSGFYYKSRRLETKKYEIIGFLDNDSSKWGMELDGKIIVNPNEITYSEYDKVIVAAVCYGDIINQLLDLKVPEKKIDILYSLPFNSNYCISVKEAERRIDCHIDNINLTGGIYNESGLGFIREIFEEGVYNLHIATKKDIVVIDIGMNIGVAALFFAAKQNVKKVYGFEPFLPTYQKALDNFRVNSDEIQKKISSFQFALGNHEETKYCGYSEKVSSSLSVLGESEKIKEELNNSQKERIAIKDAGKILQPILNSHRNDYVVLKIDCEGSEYDIFESIDRYRLLDEVDAVLMEWHELLEGDAGKHKQLERMMTDYHFSYVINGPVGAEIGMLYALKRND